MQLKSKARELPSPLQILSLRYVNWISVLITPEKKASAMKNIWKATKQEKTDWR